MQLVAFEKYNQFIDQTHQQEKYNTKYDLNMALSLLHIAHAIHTQT